MSIATSMNYVLRRSRAALLMIPILFVCANLSAQNVVTVKGRILDEKNAPVTGASVTVKNASNGVTTDGEGNFSITVPPRSTLVISHIGFAPREISARVATGDIVLHVGNSSLDQVVVIGYGKKSR